MDASHPLFIQIEAICKALRRKSMLSLTYGGTEQLVVEPIVLGVEKNTGKTMLRCYKSYPPHIHDSKENWMLLDVSEISNLKTTPVRAKKFRKGGTVLTEDMAEVIEASDDYLKGKKK